MPSNRNTGSGRVRVSYVEDKEVADRLEEIAGKTRLTLSDIVREATWRYLRGQDSSKSSIIEADLNRPKPKKRRRG